MGFCLDISVPGICEAFKHRLLWDQQIGTHETQQSWRHKAWHHQHIYGLITAGKVEIREPGKDSDAQPGGAWSFMESWRPDYWEAVVTEEASILLLKAVED